MAAKKYYTVKKGKTTGIFNNWEDCKASVGGYPNADFKGFPTLEEAKAYLGDTPALVMQEELLEKKPAGKPSKAERAEPDAVPTEAAVREEDSEPVIPEGRLLAYVDGSYDDAIKKYAFGCVFLLRDGAIRLAFGNGENPQSLQHRNVTGEMLGAMYAVKTAMMNGFAEVELCYDYEGIEKWVTGSWRSKTELTQKYAVSMRDWGKSIRIFFTKVTAHSNVKYNELADRTAKRGLTEGDGVPKVTKLENLELYTEEA